MTQLSASGKGRPDRHRKGQGAGYAHYVDGGREKTVFGNSGRESIEGSKRWHGGLCGSSSRESAGRNPERNDDRHGTRRAEFAWGWEPNKMGDMLDAAGPQVKSFTTWDRGTLIDKYGVKFYHGDPSKSTMAFVRGDKGWQISRGIAGFLQAKS